MEPLREPLIESGPMPALLDAASEAGRVGGLGGKGGNLWRLSRAHLPVPPWFGIDAALYAGICARILPQLAGMPPGEYARQGQALLAELFPWQALEAALAPRLSAGRFYAVRSSASGEDAPQDSFAGQFDSFLQVPASEVIRHVLFCWQSAFAPRLLVYLHERGMAQPSLRMAVVIQEMVSCQAAGVMFMANPVGALTEVVVSAGYGLGEGVVRDSVEADTYIYDRLSRQWSYSVVPKQFLISPGHFGGTERTLVAPELQAKPVLDTEHCQTLLELGQQVEVLYDRPQDLEWALDPQGRFWLLQARPITTLPGGEITIFDSAGLSESFPGLTSPLTFSWLRAAYSGLFRNGARRLGLSPAILTHEAATFDHLLGLLQGRVYADLTSWEHLLKLIPAPEKLLQSWKEQLGLRRPGPQASEASRSDLRAWLRLGRYYLSLDKRLAAFRAHFGRVTTEFWSDDHRSHEPRALLATYKRLLAALLPDWDLTLLNDGYAFVFAELSKELLTRAGFADAGSLFNDLLCGDEDMESVEPVHSVLALAAEARREPALQAALQAQLAAYDPEALELSFPAFYQQLIIHLERYGDRSLGELKLETLTLREDPRLLLRWILDYLPTPLTLETLNRREQQIRGGAEQRLRSESKLGPLLKPVLNFALNQARRCINSRESARLDRARAFGMVRRLFRSLGAKLSERGLLRHADEVFYLSIEELEQLVYGSGPQTDWRALLDQRQSQYQAWSQLAQPERIHCRGPVGLNLIPLRRSPKVPGSQSLSGTGCAPGIVSAEAVVVANPAEARDLQGKILVAETTDPGWVFLMIQAAGLVVEKGSMLSHTAIIGRELGIPTIVGVPEATRRIHTGQTITINGQTGEVTRA